MSIASNESRASAWWRTATPRQRVRIFLIPIVVSFIGLGALHTRDAQAHGESLWPGLVGLPLAGTALMVALTYFMRPMPGLTAADSIKVRSRRVMKWIGPLGAFLVLAAAVAQFIASRG